MFYSRKTLEIFKNPQNVGSIENPDGFGTARSRYCSDYAEIFLRIEGGTVISGTFLTNGCCAAISASSVFTDMIKNKTLEECEKITKEDISKALDHLPLQKITCSLVIIDAFKNAVENYRKK